MTRRNLEKQMISGILCVAALAIAASTATAGKEVFVRTKPHVNVGASGHNAAANGLSSGPQSSARKWCGPGGRLCIENGRWTWKKKKKK